MAATGFKGIDSVQSGNEIVRPFSFKDASGNRVTSGSGVVRIFELQSDGTLKTYDFNDDTFKANGTAVTTPTSSLTHRQGVNSTYDTGIWTFALSTLTGFTRGGVYIVQANHSSALPLEQERMFVYGEAEGDFTVNSSGTVARVTLTDTITTYTGNTPQTGDVYPKVDTEVAAIKAKTDNLPSSPAAVGSAMTLDLTQAVPTSNTAHTTGDALNAARTQGFGKWVKSGTTVNLYASDGTTVVRSFTLDDATTPTSRT